MPDALYRERQSAQELVIERTSLVHPTDYIRWHEKDHRIINYLSTNLPDALRNGPYQLEMPLLHKLERTHEVTEIAREICEFLSLHWQECVPGRPLAFGLESPPFYNYCLLHRDDCSWDEDLTGPWEVLRFSMSCLGRIPRVVWTRVAVNAVLDLLKNAIQHAQRKFACFPDATKVLLLERHGDIHGPLTEKFVQLVSNVSIAPELDEIWDAWVETPDCDLPYWIFTRIWARDQSLPAGWRKPEVCCLVGCYCKKEHPDEGVFWFERTEEPTPEEHGSTDDSL